MSEFTHHKLSRISLIIKLTKALINRNKVGELYTEYQSEINKIIPDDVIEAVDELMTLDFELEDLKTAINKLLNLIYNPINSFKSTEPKEGQILWFLMENNAVASDLLNKTTSSLKAINKEAKEQDKQNLLNIYNSLQEFTHIYTIKENVLFPLLEEKWTYFKCGQMMWSFHDDIRRDLKEIISLLNGQQFDLTKFNRLAGDISFRITAIKFRDEKILFPHVLDTIPEKEIEALLIKSKALTYPFVKPDFETLKEEEISFDGLVNLGSGVVSAEQIKLIFNHLPVDITFVDENNKVKYYSTPKHRIFPRTNAILGRDVNNCHPPESVHVVEQIVDAFKKGEKEKASFWIHMSGQFILIQYFAVRNETGRYKGVLEVSQEISEIQGLEGDKRLLDWE